MPWGGDRSKVKSTQTSSGRSTSIRTLMRPNPDVRMLATLFIQIAMDEMKREDERNAIHNNDR
jgi:hypothetical protein